MRIKDNSTLIMGKISTNAEQGIRQASERAIEMVKEKILYGYNEPHGKDGHTEIVDTGALYDSIRAETKRVSQNAFSFEVGTDLPYAVYVHEGTHKLRGRAFIRDAMIEGAEELNDIIGNDLRKGF